MSHEATSETPRIRPATVEDAAGIARVFIESAEYHARLDPDRYWVPAFDTVVAQYRDRGRRLLNPDGDAITLVAELDGQVVGFVDARLDRSADLMHGHFTYCHIAEIAVGVDHQSQGVGDRLLTAAEDWGRRRGAHLASLDYLAVNTRASVFYQRRMGYRVAAVMAIKPLG